MSPEPKSGLCRPCSTLPFSTGTPTSVPPLSETEVDQFVATMKTNGSDTDVITFFPALLASAVLEVVTNPAFNGKHHFKTAALDKTIAYPIETDLYLGDHRLLFGLILLAVTALIDNLRMSKKTRTDHG